MAVTELKILVILPNIPMAKDHFSLTRIFRIRFSQFQVLTPLLFPNVSLNLYDTQGGLTIVFVLWFVFLGTCYCRSLYFGVLVTLYFKKTCCFIIINKWTNQLNKYCITKLQPWVTVNNDKLFGINTNYRMLKSNDTSCNVSWLTLKYYFAERNRMLNKCTIIR